MFNLQYLISVLDLNPSIPRVNKEGIGMVSKLEVPFDGGVVDVL